VKNLKLIYHDIINGFTKLTSEHHGEIFYKHLTIEDSASIEDTGDVYTEKATKIGLPTEKQQIKILDEQGIWTDKEELELHNLRILVEGLKTSRRKVFLQKDIAAIEKEAENSVLELKKLEGIKQESLSLTVEKYAQKKSSEYYIQNVLFKDSKFETPVITQDAFDELSEIDLGKIYETYVQISQMFEDTILKRIALAPFFLSIFYICDDNPMILFGKPVIKLTYNQTNLFTYARYYKHMLSEAKVKPPQELYEDPEKLVDWLESAKEGQKVLEKAMPEDGQAGGTSIVGATKEDLQKMGIDSSSTRGSVNLSKEAAKKGGTLEMEDFIRLHG
jgi:hypothetical protein